MQTVSITTIDGISEVVIDFSDEVGDGTPVEKCRTTGKVSGDPSVYIQSLADDFRRNNPDLFAAEGIITEEGLTCQDWRGLGDGL